MVAVNVSESILCVETFIEKAAVALFWTESQKEGGRRGFSVAVGSVTLKC